MRILLQPILGLILTLCIFSANMPWAFAEESIELSGVRPVRIKQVRKPALSASTTPQSYFVQNATLEISAADYQTIDLVEQTIPLEGTLKNSPYVAVLYTFQNKAGGDKTVIIEQSASATQALQRNQTERIRLGKSLLLLAAPVVLPFSVLSIPIEMGTGGVGKSTFKNGKICDAIILSILFAPISLPLAATSTVFGVAYAAVLIPANLVAAPVLYPLDRRNDTLAKAQLARLDLKTDHSRLEIKTGETMQFAVLAKTEARLGERLRLKVVSKAD